MRTIQKPQAGEYTPFAETYINLVPDDGLVLEHLRNSLSKVKELVTPLSAEKLITPCAEGEWTIQEILIHIIDAERIMACRCLRFARNDSTEQPGFDPNSYVPSSRANQRTLADILEEYTAVRMATLALFNSLEDEAFTRSGIANKHNWSVRGGLYQITGHELHHLASIKENYL